MHNQGRITVKSIAREANVSVTTVSLALDGKGASRVSQVTRERILEIADRLNYRPNLLARSLVTKRTQSIGLVVTSLANPVYAEVAEDIIDHAANNGYGVLICSVGGREDEQLLIGELIDRGVDGLIICSASRSDPMVHELAESDIPFVLTCRGVDQDPSDPVIDFIGVDDRRGGYMAMEHLIGLGHRRLALIAGPQEISTGYQRLLGAKAAVRDYGLELPDHRIAFGKFTRRSGREAALAILRAPDRPTAVFVANDHMAMGALDAARELNLNVPEDVAVIGFDNMEMTNLPGVDLTTISQKREIWGRLAVNRLIEKIESDGEMDPEMNFLDPLLIIRRSCGCPAEERDGSPTGEGCREYER